MYARLRLPTGNTVDIYDAENAYNTAIANRLYSVQIINGNNVIDATVDRNGIYSHKRAKCYLARITPNDKRMTFQKLGDIWYKGF